MQAAPLIGRDRELDDIVARVRVSRLVTLIGPGGVGKTALARRVAEVMAAEFPHGSRWVDLTRIDEGAAVRGALAAQLGFDSFDALIASPGDHPVLMIVDNCEHVLEWAATAVMEVLGSCQQPSIVATSRSPLDLPGESVVAVAPLPLPDDVDPATSPSVELFLARSRDAGADVEGVDLAAVASLCRRLDGLPLAIEIAAARTRTATVGEIGERLEASTDVLSRPRFRGDPRHRSVSDTIRWSFELLGPGAQQLLPRLAVCQGTFDLDLARALVDDGSGGSDVDDDLDELVHASLLVVDVGDGVTRYRLLDTVRRFGLERLTADSQLDAARDRFIDHVVDSTGRTVAGSTGTWRPTLVRDLALAFDDIAEALHWCTQHDDDPRRAYALCSILWGIVHQGHADDIVRLARRTLDRWPDDGSRAHAQCVATLATAEYVTGHPERAVEIASAALSSLHRPGLPSVTLRRVIGQASAALGHSDEAIECFDAGAAVGRELGMEAMAIELDVAAGSVLADAGHVDEAIERIVRAVDDARRAGSELSECWARAALGWVMLRQDPAAAAPVIRVGLEHARRIDYPIGVAVGIRSMAYARLLDDDVAGAAAHLGELLDRLIERGALSNIRLLVDVAAAVAQVAGHPDAELLAATLPTLPITTLANTRFQLVPLADTSAPPLTRREAIIAVRTIVEDLTSPMADDAASANVPVNEFRRRGDVFEITYRGRSFSARSSKGLVDLARLLAAPGRELHCLDLAGAAVEEPSTGELADVTARRQYEERIRELQEDIDDAEANQDFGRSYKAQVELDTLIEHLTSVVGRHGRGRRQADTAERARSAVTHRLRAAIRQLGQTHPELGRHLANAVSTGTYCSYRPEVPTSWSVESADR